MSISCEELTAALHSGESNAVFRLREAVTARRGEVGDHARWGRLCERCVGGVEIIGTGVFIERQDEDILV